MTTPTPAETYEKARQAEAALLQERDSHRAQAAMATDAESFAEHLHAVDWLDQQTAEKAAAVATAHAKMIDAKRDEFVAGVPGRVNPLYRARPDAFDVFEHAAGSVLATELTLAAELRMISAEAAELADGHRVIVGPWTVIDGANLRPDGEAVAAELLRRLAPVIEGMGERSLADELRSIVRGLATLNPPPFESETAA